MVRFARGVDMCSRRRPEAVVLLSFSWILSTSMRPPHLIAALESDEKRCKAGSPHAVKGSRPYG